MIRKQYDAEMTEASNQAFNLAMSAALIASKDMGFSNEMVQELSQRVFGILDDVADNLATIDSMLHLVESWGIEIYHTAQEHTEKQGETLRKKTSVFQILESGIYEIEDILNVAKKHGIQIDYRDACTWRWEFNSIKYWRDTEMALTKASEAIHMMKDGKSKEEIMTATGCTESSYATWKCSYNQMYTEDGNVTPKMQECWDGFKEGMTVPEVIKVTGYGKSFVFNAYNEYLLIEERKKPKEERKPIESIKETAKKAANVKTTEVLSVDEFTDKFFADMEQGQKKEDGQDGAKEEVATSNEGSKAREGNEEARETTSKKEQENTTGAKVEETSIEDGTDLAIFNGEDVQVFTGTQGQGKGMYINKEFEEAVKGMEASRTPKLKKIVKLVEIQGEFTTYKPLMENSFEMEVDGQIITLSREQMIDFGRELIAVAEEEF